MPDPNFIEPQELPVQMEPQPAAAAAPVQLPAEPAPTTPVIPKRKSRRAEAIMIIGFALLLIAGGLLLLYFAGRR